MTRENKDEWSHWLQIRPLESTARALSAAIYYIHECDLWGVWGGVDGGPTCSTQPLRHWLPEDQTGLLCSPLFSSLSLSHKSYIGGDWPTFPPFECYYLESRVIRCVCLCGWVGLWGWTKASPLHFRVQRQRRNWDAREKRVILNRMLLHAEIVSVMASRAGLLTLTGGISLRWRRWSEINETRHKFAQTNG